MIKTALIIILIAASAMALMMVGLGLKVWLRKEPEYRRPCANADPATGRCAHCTCKDTKRKSSPNA